MELQMTVTLGNILTIIGMIITIVGVIVVLDRRIEHKADKEIMTKELENIRLALQRLSDQITQVNDKMDDMKEEMDSYRRIQDQLQRQALILQTEHDARKHSC